jgi:hypothetical protein
VLNCIANFTSTPISLLFLLFEERLALLFSSSLLLDSSV